MILMQIFVLLSSFTIVFAIIEINVTQNSRFNNIPPTDDPACMARYIVHNSKWCALAYVSENDESTRNFPLTRVYSISDGTENSSTGILYFMVSPFDLTIQDLFKDNKCSVLMSLAQSHYCFKKRYDPEDPRCAQVILTGHFEVISNKTEEFQFAKNALWSRHPIMKIWYETVTSHKWFFAKVTISKITVVDYFGGRKFPTIAEYFNKNCTQYKIFTIADFTVTSTIDSTHTTI